MNTFANKLVNAICIYKMYLFNHDKQKFCFRPPSFQSGLDIYYLLYFCNISQLK